MTTPSAAGASARPAGRSQRKQDVDELLAELSVDIRPPHSDAAPGSTHGTPTKTHLATPRVSSGAKHTDDAQSLLDDLEGMVQRRRTPVPSSTAASNTTSPGPSLAAADSPKPQAVASTRTGPPAGGGAGEDHSAAAAAPPPHTSPTPGDAQEAPAAWGQWGSLLTNAAKFADQARHELERRAAAVVHTGESTGSTAAAGTTAAENSIQDLGLRMAQGLRGFVKDARLEEIRTNLTAAGVRGWNDVLNAVAPPVEAHESVVVTLSYDMDGYEGLVQLTFRVLSRILQHADIDRVSVARAAQSTDVAADTDSARSQPSSTDPLAHLHVAATRKAAVQRAKAALTELIGSASRAREDAADEGISTCPVLLRVQPFFEPTLSAENASLFPGEAAKAEPQEGTPRDQSIYFFVWWVDPVYRLSHATCSQAIPAWWLTVPLEENAWVEQAMGDVLEGALAVVAQDYVQSRLSAFAHAAASVAENASRDS
ncbi:hypothetical protein MSPP1_003865 [Malassezia sp. CBS 17886]|nr:hypothetical protein MSPP1_003865 [Malassezia sp. CBS 17886]